MLTRDRELIYKCNCKGYLKIMTKKSLNKANVNFYLFFQLDPCARKSDQNNVYYNVGTCFCEFSCLFIFVKINCTFYVLTLPLFTLMILERGIEKWRIEKCHPLLAKNA